MSLFCRELAGFFRGGRVSEFAAETVSPLISATAVTKISPAPLRGLLFYGLKVGWAMLRIARIQESGANVVDSKRGKAHRTSAA